MNAYSSPSSFKILLVPSSFAPKFGGLETAMRYLSAELVSRGHDVNIITNRYPRSLRAFEMIHGIPVHRMVFTDFVPSRVQLSRLSKFLLGVVLAPMQLARLTNLVRVLKPQVVNAHYLGVTAPYIWGACAAKSLPFVISVHGSDLTTTPFPSGHEKLTRFVARKAKTHTACSENLAGYLRTLMGSHCKDNVIVTGNGVDAVELETGESFLHSRPYLLAASHLTPKKGVDVLIHAFAKLAHSGHEIDLIIAGNGPCEDGYKLLVWELNLGARVHFWGAATRREMAALLHGCLLFVMPSLWEAFGITSLEAMVCRKAVVASRVGGIPEVVRDQETGVLVPPGDSTALAIAIADLVRNAEKREALGARGREVALSQFTWSAVTDRYLQAYQRARES